MRKVLKKNSNTIDEKFLEKSAGMVNVFTVMNECLWVGDKNHKTLYVNPMFEKLSGYSLKECIGTDCDSFFDEKGKRTIAGHHKLRTKGKSSQYEATMISKEGKEIPLLINGAPTDTGGTIGIFTDLSEVKKLEAKEKLLSRIIRNSSEALVVLDKSWRITVWNAGAEKLFGYKEEEVIGKPIDIIVPDGDSGMSQAVMKEVEKRGAIRAFEAKRLTKNKGRIVDVIVSVSRVNDDGGKFIGYLIFYSDVTDRKRTTNELQKRFEAIQDAYKELGLQKRQIDYMQEISNLAVSDASLSALENLIVSAIALLTKADAAVLRFYDPKTESLRLRACVGVSEAWWSKDKISFKNNLMEEAFKNKRAVIVDEIATDPRYLGGKLARAHNFRMVIIVPLFINDIVIGSLSLYAIDPAKFRFIETDFLENFGKICALSVYVKRTTGKNAR